MAVHQAVEMWFIPNSLETTDNAQHNIYVILGSVPVRFDHQPRPWGGPIVPLLSIPLLLSLVTVFSSPCFRVYERKN
jgi:hypothetical protein